VNHVLFITATFRTKVAKPKEAHRRLNSLMNKLRKRYGSYLWVLGCQVRGSLHYHLLVFVAFDCHNGTDLTAWSAPLIDTDDKDHAQRTAMNPLLRVESDWWTKMAPRFGFGRIEVAPVYSNPKRVRKYMQIQAPEACRIALGNTRYVRFWSCSRDLKSGSTKFAWKSPGAKRGRDMLKYWALEQGCLTYEDLCTKVGPRWGWQYIRWCDAQESVA